MSTPLRYVVGVVTLVIGVAIAALPNTPDRPRSIVSYWFAGYLLLCAACCFFPQLARAGGGRIVAAGASMICITLTVLVVLKMRTGRESAVEAHMLFYMPPIAVGTAWYSVTGRLPRWLAFFLHVKYEEKE